MAWLIKYSRILLIAAAACLFFGYLIVVEIRSARRNKLPVCTEHARLVRKVLHVDEIGALYGNDRHIDELVFETRSGEIVKVRVARSTSLTIPVDAEGTLTWQGDRFGNFETEQREGTL